jgi:uncharacterized protein
MAITGMIIHGTYGSPFAFWMPSIAHRVREAGGSVYVPSLPSPAAQDFDTWASIVDAYFKQGLLGENPVMIGVSSGAVFATKYLLSRQMTGALLVTVSGFNSHFSGHEESDTANASFYVDDADLTAVSRHFARRVAFYSRNDPFLPYSTLDRFATLIEAEKRIVDEAGHFDNETGYGSSFPELEALLAEFGTSTPDSGHGL